MYTMIKMNNLKKEKMVILVRLYETRVCFIDSFMKILYMAVETVTVGRTSDNRDCTELIQNLIKR